MPWMAVMAIASVVGAGASIYSGIEQKKAQEEANEVLSAQETINDLNTKRKSVKEARVARARLMQQSSASGTSGGSGEQGALSGLQTQLGAGMAQMTGQASTANALTNINERLADKMLFSQSVGAIAGATGSIAGAKAAQPKKP